MRYTQQLLKDKAIKRANNKLIKNIIKNHSK